MPKPQIIVSLGRNSKRMSGAAQKQVPFEENPTIEKETVKRQSRRKRGLEPNLEIDNADKNILTREWKALTTKGGRGGRSGKDASDWTYFPAKKSNVLNFLPREDRKEKNRSLFQNSTVEDGNEVNDGKDKMLNGIFDNEGAYRLMKLKNIEDAINSHLASLATLF